MLSVRLSEPLQAQLVSYCVSTGISKSAVVQQALEKHLKSRTQAHAGTARRTRADPLLALIGTGNRKHTTEQIMRMTRGNGWNKP